MKFVNLSAGIFASFLLVACGGGSDDNTTFNNISSTTTTPQNPSIISNASIQGSLMPVNAGKAGSVSATASSSGVNKVVIAGQEVDFYPSGISSNTLQMNAGNMARVGGSSRLNYTRYGYIREGANGTPHLFAQGAVTTTMPAGTARYQGAAAHLQNNQIDIHQATFDVNFGTNTLTGTIAAPSPVNLSATISGNSFSGTNNGITTTGRFYGVQAAELGGVYKNDDGSVAGAYGAQK